MFPFKGTDEIYVVNTIADAPTFEDIEWEQEAHVKVEMNIKNALGALMTAYSAFSDDSDNEKLTDMKINTESSSKIEDTDKHISDNEMPLHQPIARVPLPNFLENENKEISTLAVENESSSITGTNIQKRRRVRNAKIKKTKPEQKLSEIKKNIRSNVFVKAKTTLLENLLQNEIRHERNVLLQCVRYVVNNNYLSK